jgi:hypothetical protein
MTISRHPGSSAGPLPSLPVRPTRDSPFRAMHAPTVSPADVCSELGPRSLDPDRSFWSAYAELIRGQTSPTDFCNCTSTCGQPNPSSSALAGTEASTSFLFSTCHALSLAGAVTRGEPRDVHPRQPRCRFVLLAQVCPTAMPPRMPHLRGLRLRSVVRIDVHGSKDRVKDASPDRRRRSLVPASGACALWRMPTTFPSSAPFGHPLSSARLLQREETHRSRRTDQGPRSDDAPRRAPPSRRPGCLSPSRHAKECVCPRRDCSLRPSRRLSRSRRPHFVPSGDGAFDWALRGHGAVTRGSVTGSRVQTPF